MRGKYRKKGWLCAALAAVLCLTLALPQKNSLARGFIDTEHEDNTLKVNKENLNNEDWLKEDASLANAEIDVYLYKIADVNQYGEYTLTTASNGFDGLVEKSSDGKVIYPNDVVKITELNKGAEEPEPAPSAASWSKTASWTAKLLELPVFSSEKNENKEEPPGEENGEGTEAEGEEQKSDGQKFYMPDDETLRGLSCYYDKITIPAAADENQPLSVEQGLYLVWAKPVVTEKYLYTFLPYLVSVPDNAYGREGDPNTDSDDWNYNVVVDLKPERQERYLDLEIDKTLLNYQPTSGVATFIFEIRAEKEEITEDGKTATKVVYDDVVGLEFTGDGQKSVRVRNIPAGSKVTITEIRTGTTYKLVSRNITPEDGVTLETTETTDGIIINSLSGRADWVSSQGTGEERDNELVASVSFTNDYSEDGPKTDSIINRFTRIDGKWTGAQIITNQGGEEVVNE